MIRAALVAASALALAGCGDNSIAPNEPAKKAPRADRSSPWPKLPRCPDDAANCASARGTNIYVEAVDPDGDGDAHFVLTGSHGVTGPGISVIDVEKEMRPHPLPRPGDLVSAAGPVYRGSYGQRQVEDLVVHHER